MPPTQPLTQPLTQPVPVPVPGTQPTPSSPEFSPPAQPLDAPPTRPVSIARIEKFLHHVCQGELIPVLRALKREPALATASNFRGDTPLWLSAVYGRLDCLRALLAVATFKDLSLERCPLVCASKFDRVECLQELIAHCDPHSLARRATEALLHACVLGHTRCLDVLLPYGNPKAFWCTGIAGRLHHNALHLAAMSGSVDCVPRLLAVLDPMGRTHNSQDHTALMLAAFHGHPQCVRDLLPHSDPNATSRDGLTALSMAVGSSYTPGAAECAKLLFVATAPSQWTQGANPFLLAFQRATSKAQPWIDKRPMWGFLDFAASHVPRSQALQALAHAPPGAMPHFQALLERETLTQSLAPAASSLPTVLAQLSEPSPLPARARSGRRL